MPQTIGNQTAYTLPEVLERIVPEHWAPEDETRLNLMGLFGWYGQAANRVDGMLAEAERRGWIEYRSVKLARRGEVGYREQWASHSEDTRSRQIRRTAKFWEDNDDLRPKEAGTWASGGIEAPARAPKAAGIGARFVPLGDPGEEARERLRQQRVEDVERSRKAIDASPITRAEFHEEREARREAQQRLTERLDGLQQSLDALRDELRRSSAEPQPVRRLGSILRNS